MRVDPVRSALSNGGVLVLSACLVAATLACAPPAEVAQRDTTSENETAIGAIIGQFMQAYNAGDAYALSGLFSDDAIRLPPNGDPIVGIDAIRLDLLATFEDFAGDITVNQEEARLSGDFGVARGTWAVRLVPKGGGDAVEDVGKWLNMLERQDDGSWKIARNMWNSDRPLPN